MTPDRRIHTRRELDRPCKLYRPGQQAYCLARTHNVSVGGAMLEVIASRPIAVGETVDLAIALRGEAVLSAGRSIPATVIRADAIDADRQRVAVRFDQPTAAALAA